METNQSWNIRAKRWNWDRGIQNDKGECLEGKEAADDINRYFAGMGRLNGVPPPVWNDQSMNMKKKNQEFEFKFIEMLEVHQLIKRIDINKASGVERINSRILKDCFVIYEFELKYLFNCAIHTMKFPVDWKRSIVTPIPKSGDKLNPGNWRPINNLCVPGKMLEKCVYRQVEEYMEKNQYICKNQHGFRKGKGTDTAVMELVRELFSNINKNNSASILFLDYSRAFNTVDHEILLNKMSMYGFSVNVCNWFRDYFKDRIQFTKISTVLSSGVPIEHGVYQGSPLGPLLFIIYINDIVRMNDSVFCNMYADDTVIVCSDKDAGGAVCKSVNAFKEIQEWCLLNKIGLNKQKTRHMLLGSGNQIRNGNCYINVEGIIMVENFMYLGVNIDNRLNFEKIVNGTISRVNVRLITLARIRKLLDVGTSLLIYKQTILPILDYVSILVNSSMQRKIVKLQPLQNRAIKIIEKCTGYISTEDVNKLHVKLKLLQDRRKMFMLKIMYKLSRDAENVNTYRPEVTLRTGPKVKMKIAFTDKERVC